MNAQQRAHAAVAKAIREGDLRPATELDCVDCGRVASGYDHRDYKRPLEVEPTCQSCNMKRGAAAGWSTGNLRIRERQEPLVGKTIRLTEDEWVGLADAAHGSGMSLAMYTRLLLSRAVSHFETGRLKRPAASEAA